MIENRKVSNSHTVASRIFSELSGSNPKTGSFFGKIIKGIDIAIEQEKSLEQDLLQMARAIGSNVGSLIEEMREDPRKKLLYKSKPSGR